MAFAIRISDKPAPDDIATGSGKDVMGEIEIDDFRETIVFPLGYWTKSDYISHWAESIQSLLDGEKDGKAGLIVEMYDPKHADYVNCWALYREGEVIYVHNQMIFMENLDAPFEFGKLNQYIGDRETESDDGRQISEWKTSVPELRVWLEQLKKS